jgi:hypothetical protein
MPIDDRPDDPKTPAAPAVPTGGVGWKALCPFCGRWHHHGDAGEGPAGLGWRTADCGGGDYYVVAADLSECLATEFSA